MKKHVRDDGSIGPCSAKDKKDCPYGNNPHGFNEAELKEHAEQLVSKRYGSMPDTMRKESPMKKIVADDPNYQAISKNIFSRIGYDRKIDNALMIAVIAHKGQTRKDGKDTPYVYHPFSVFNRALNDGCEAKYVLSAALCHDVAEDGVDNFKENMPEIFDGEQGNPQEKLLSFIESNTDKETRNIVESMTNKDSNGNAPKGISRDEKAQRYIDDLNNRIQHGTTVAVLVKYYDFMDNNSGGNFGNHKGSKEVKRYLAKKYLGAAKIISSHFEENKETIEKMTNVKFDPLDGYGPRKNIEDIASTLKSYLDNNPEK